jgi:hypothetical protein
VAGVVSPGRRGQAIAEPAHRFDAVSADLLAQPADEHLDGVRIAVEILIVEVLDQFGATDHPAMMHHQIVQQTVFERGQAQRLAIDAGPRRAGIKPQRTQIQGRGRVTGRTAHQRAQARQQFLGVEGLGQIVVGPCVKAGDLLAPGAARSQDQHRRGDAVLAPTLQHRDAVDLGQAQIEHDGVVGLGIAQKLRLFTVRGVIDGITGVGQRQLELTRDIGIVLDDEYAHTA